MFLIQYDQCLYKSEGEADLDTARDLYKGRAPHDREGRGQPRKATDGQPTTRCWDRGVGQILLHGPREEPILPTP